MKRALITAIAAAAPFGVVLAQDLSWQGPLNDRLLREQNCKVSFYTGIVERSVDGKQLIIAKAHCEDKRAFDVARNAANEPFTIKECRPTPTAC